MTGRLFYMSAVGVGNLVCASYIFYFSIKNEKMLGKKAMIIRWTAIFGIIAFIVGIAGMLIVG